MVTSSLMRKLPRGFPPYPQPPHAVLLTALFTGMRQGEILALPWRAVDFGTRQIIVEQQTVKSGKTRAIPMTRDLEKALRDLRRSRKVTSLHGSEPVFAFPDRSPLTEDVVRAMFNRALARCEAIPTEKKMKITFHTLRHTAASLMQKAGVSLFDIGRILGHSNAQTTLRYAHLFADETRGAIDRLGEIVDLGNRSRSRSRTRQGPRSARSRSDGPPSGPPRRTGST